jgi:hypothetical protein
MTFVTLPQGETGVGGPQKKAGGIPAKHSRQRDAFDKKTCPHCDTIKRPTLCGTLLSLVRMLAVCSSSQRLWHQLQRAATNETSHE